MSDSQIPILTRAPEDTTEQVTEVMTELTEQTKFLSSTLNKSIKSNEKIKKRNDDQKKKDDQMIKKEKVVKNEEIKSEDQFKQFDFGFATEPIKKLGDAGVNSMKLAQETFLGDISFATDPIKKMGGILGNIGGFFNIKKKKIAPKRAAMLKTNPEAVYITDTLLKADEKTSFLDKFKGLLPLLLGSGAAGALAKMFGPLVTKAGAIGLLAGGLLWMAIDGFKGYFKAEEWGTSKIAAVIGGAFGGTGKGWKNAFKGMGKGAMVGAGSGFLIAGVPGALIGGLLGAAIGGILGFIGGEKIAKTVDAMGKDVKQFGKDLGEGFKNLIPAVKESWFSLKEAGIDFKNMFLGWWTPLKEGASSFFTKAGEAITNFITGTLDLTKIVGNWINDKIILPVSGFFEGIYIKLDEMTGGALSQVVTWFTDFILSPIGDFFGAIGGFLKDLFFISDEEKELNKTKAAAFREENKLLTESAINRGRGIPTNTPSNRTYSIIPVDDAIIKPDGSIIKTHVDDTIIATKNPIAFADKQSSSMAKDINAPVGNVMFNLEVLIKELISKQSQPNQTNTVMQNITSRYSPQAVMANLTTEVF